MPLQYRIKHTISTEKILVLHWFSECKSIPLRETKFGSEFSSAS